MWRILLGVCVFFFGSLPAQSEIYTFKVRSLHPNAVQIKFYSQVRKGHQWPTSKTAWDLADDEVHALGMRCNRNEKICWGAWVKGTGRPEWGAGVGGTDACQNCCFICQNAETDGVWTLNVRTEGNRVVPTQRLIATTTQEKPPKTVLFDDD